MSTNVIGTDIRSIGAKLNWFTNVANKSLMEGDINEFSYKDAVGLAKMIKMISIRRTCHHISTRNRNMYGHERTPANWSNIPTLVEEMAVNFVGLMNAGGSARVNEIISTIICDTICLIDTAMMYVHEPTKGLDIICLNLTSGSARKHDQVDLHYIAQDCIQE